MNSKKTVTSKRPLAITVLSFVVLLAAMGSLLLAALSLTFLPTGRSIRQEMTLQYGSWYLPYLVVDGVLNAVAVVGLWKMKRWAVYLYTTTLLVSLLLVVSFFPHRASPLVSLVRYVFPLVAIGVGLKYLKKMT